MSYRFPLIALVLVTTTASCVPVPLGDPEKSKVRKEYLGLWLSDNNLLVDVQQFDKRTYVIDWMQYDTRNGKVGHRNLIKGWITEIKGTRFFTLQVFQVDSPNNPSTKGSVVSMGKIELKNKRLHISLFKDSVFKNVSKPDQLRKVLEARHADGKIYSDPMQLERVTKDDKRAAIILKAFARK